MMMVICCNFLSFCSRSHWALLYKSEYCYDLISAAMYGSKPVGPGVGFQRNKQFSLRIVDMRPASLCDNLVNVGFLLSLHKQFS